MNKATRLTVLWISIGLLCLGYALFMRNGPQQTPCGAMERHFGECRAPW